MTIDSTLSGENANSYVTLSYADDYFANHYNADKTATWASFSDEQKTALLIHATALGIEKLTFVAKHTLQSMNYTSYVSPAGLVYSFNDLALPYKAVFNQRLQFPRTVDINSSSQYFIPEDVKYAQCEQAVYLAEQIDDESLDNSAKGIKAESFTVGPIKSFQEFDSGRGVNTVSPIAKQMLENYLLKNVGGASLFRA